MRELGLPLTEAEIFMLDLFKQFTDDDEVIRFAFALGHEWVDGLPIDIEEAAEGLVNLAIDRLYIED